MAPGDETRRGRFQVPAKRAIGASTDAGVRALRLPARSERAQKVLVALRFPGFDVASDGRDVAPAVSNPLDINTRVAPGRLTSDA
jgi:hypothetical protein